MTTIHNKLFNKQQLQYLYQIGEAYLDQAKAWDNNYNHTNIVHENIKKLEAIVELLESIIVFYHGDGIDAFNNKKEKRKSLIERFNSFKSFLFEK